VTRELAVVLTAGTGGLIALQAPVNGGLGRAIGTWQATFVSFAIGTAVLALAAALAKGGLGQISDARHVSWYYLTGGVLGAIYIATVVATVGSLGAGGVVAATIAGQLAVSIVADRFGWLGLERQPITLAKVAGVALLAIGTYLVVRE
jgi:transporter family-2 protein